MKFENPNVVYYFDIWWVPAEWFAVMGYCVHVLIHSVWNGTHVHIQSENCKLQNKLGTSFKNIFTANSTIMTPAYKKQDMYNYVMHA